MNEEITKMIVANGIWAALFISLFRYVLKKNDERENRYLDTIDELTSKFCIVEDIQKDVREMKERSIR